MADWTCGTEPGRFLGSGVECTGSLVFCRLRGQRRDLIGPVSRYRACHLFGSRVCSHCKMSMGVKRYESVPVRCLSPSPGVVVLAVPVSGFQAKVARRLWYDLLGYFYGF